MFGVSALVCIHVLALGLDLLSERLFILIESQTENVSWLLLRLF